MHKISARYIYFLFFILFIYFINLFHGYNELDMGQLNKGVMMVNQSERFQQAQHQHRGQVFHIKEALHTYNLDNLKVEMQDLSILGILLVH